MKVLIIDNFDSFTYNLYQFLRELGAEVDVVRNNAISIDGIREKGYEKIVISPGPGRPEVERDFGICSQIILELGKNIPVLGVCLGLQGIAYVFGGKVVLAKKPMHGKASKISHYGKGVFEGLENPLLAMRYHSLIADEGTLPDCLEITARSLDDNAIMGLRHKEYPIYGVQFHPEAILTQGGKRLLKNFLEIDGKKLVK